MGKTYRTITNGKKLAAYVGSNVVIAGNIKKVSSDKLGLEIETFDKVPINVALNDAFNDDENENNVIEVFGVAQSKSTIAADHYATFTSQENDFSYEDYNEFIDLLGKTQIKNLGQASEKLLEKKSD